MTDNHLADRARRAEKIASAPADYKVCEGCESIVAHRVITCPNCHGYRFDTEEKAVVDHARLLASRPQTSVTAENLENG